VTEEEYTVLTDMRDVKHIMEVWQHAEETTVTGLPGHILDFFHKVVEPLGEKKLANYNELTNSYNAVSEEKRSSDTIGQWVKLLQQIGWADTEPDPLDKRRKLVRLIKKAENNGECRIQQLLDSFTLENFGKWLDEVEKITAHNALLLKEKFLAEPSSQNVVYENHFCADIFLELSKKGEGSAEEKKGENSGIRHSPTIPKLLAFQDILSGPHSTGEQWHKGMCKICGEEKTIEWHVQDFKKDLHGICGECCWAYSNYLEKGGE